MIDFPLTDLDMGPYLAFGPESQLAPPRKPACTSQKASLHLPESQLAPPEYELFGIVNHFGTMHGGHYIAYVKN